MEISSKRRRPAGMLLAGLVVAARVLPQIPATLSEPQKTAFPKRRRRSRAEPMLTSPFQTREVRSFPTLPLASCRGAAAGDPSRLCALGSTARRTDCYSIEPIVAHSPQKCKSLTEMGAFHLLGAKVDASPPKMKHTPGNEGVSIHGRVHGGMKSDMRLRKDAARSDIAPVEFLWYNRFVCLHN